ncbi:laminarinase [Marinilabilia rubra]|uniref:Laminarinase n=2 Tax=Marinilabilia rubra TaxID=2162893 RepID=A0A2U2B9N2_9BACT|nr:laminarinase [Marinilabilia rubra]
MVVYYPFKGDYTVTLISKKDNEECRVHHDVSVKEDDEYYATKQELVWSDEFNGDEVNREFWTFETGATGWGNQELQDYTDGENAEVEDGTLTIVAKKIGERGIRGEYTSTRMITKDKKEFMYGRFEMRAKLPTGRGTWAAFWMLGANFPEVMWPHCGEIDIMEHVGYETGVVHSAMHTPSSFGNTRNKGSVTLDDVENEYHTYGVIWDKHSMKFYVDDPENIHYTYQPEVKNNETWPYDQPAFLLLNLAIGGTWGGKEGVDDRSFPQEYVIDYVRVYQHPDF